MKQRAFLKAAILAAVYFTASAPVFGETPARASRIGEILRIASQPEMSLIRAEVVPLQAKARVRQRLAEQGRALGLGKEWNASAPEWQDAERRIEPRIREALKAPTPLASAQGIEACLRRLSDADLETIHTVLRSDQWARYRRAMDLTGAMFALMGDVDPSLAGARDALSRRVTDMAEREMGGNVMAEVQRKFSARGAAECSQMLITDLLGHTGTILRQVMAQIDASQALLGDAAQRFKARTRKS